MIFSVLSDRSKNENITLIIVVVMTQRDPEALLRRVVPSTRDQSMCKSSCYIDRVIAVWSLHKARSFKR